MTKKQKAYEASAMGKLANFGSQFNKLVGGDGSESEPESDVRIVIMYSIVMFYPVDSSWLMFYNCIIICLYVCTVLYLCLLCCCVYAIG